MSGSDWGQIVSGGATVILLLAAARSDLLRYRISNRIVVAVVVAFLVAAAFEASLHGFSISLLAGLIMFLVGAGLFALGLFGGGDVKLIAAMALWTGLTDLPRFLLVMTATGGLLGFVWMVRRRRQQMVLANDSAPPGEASTVGTPSIEQSSATTTSNRIPYGVAIAVAGIDFFVTSAHSPFAPLSPWMQ
jgi:prepilin peptidase CpaA